MTAYGNRGWHSMTARALRSSFPRSDRTLVIVNRASNAKVHRTFGLQTRAFFASKSSCRGRCTSSMSRSGQPASSRRTGIAWHCHPREGFYPGDLSGIGDRIGQPATGVGPFRHEDKADRAPELYGGIKTLHSGPKGSTLFADASRASIEHVQINFPARIRGWRASCNGPV